MGRLFWKLFLAFCAAFAAIGVSHSLALRLAHKFDSATPVAALGNTTNTLTIYGASLLIALCLSAVLAWYLNQPIRILRRAFGAVSAGKLDTRVRHLLGSRRDSIADL